MIRPYLPTDAEAVMAIWNPVIRDTTITFSSEEKTPGSLAAMVAERRAAGREFFVAEDGGAIVGFASYAQFRGGNGYARAMEHTVVLGPGMRGRGFGRALMAAVESHARTGGAGVIYAGVSGENAAGIAFHAAVGYATVAVVPAVGWKFGRWLDLVLMQKRL